MPGDDSGVGVSIREQERRQRETERRIDDEMRRADREVLGRIEQRSRAADARAAQIVRRIERGDVEPRPLPSLREDSMESIPSSPSMQSSESMPSTPSADYASEAGGETEGVIDQDMPLKGIMPYDPESAGEDLALRVTEETGAGGDPHAHNERKADEISEQMTEGTGAGGDMTQHAEGKVEQMGRAMFQS